jgi:hypothetical protein
MWLKRDFIATWGLATLLKRHGTLAVLRTVASNILFLNIPAFPHILHEESFYPILVGFILGLITRGESLVQIF